MRLALAGGGTGGHVVPGLHLLDHLRAAGRSPEDVLWFTTGRPVEEHVFGGAGRRHPDLERVALTLEPPGSGAPSLWRLARRTWPEVRRAGRALERHRSDVLLALGGFTALPAVLAARTRGIPVVLLEINAVPGRATRSLAPLAARVVHAWPGPPPVGSRARPCLGPPLAPAFGEPLACEATAATRRGELGFDAARPLLTVLGGSQGAGALNAFVGRHAAALGEAGLQVLHQTGPGRSSEAAGDGGSAYRAVEYLDDVVRVLDASTLVLCRGGASTLAEIAARARPALVVPYPHHRDRHQERNALALGEGVRVVPEARLDGALVTVLARLAGPDGARERERMRRALETALPRDGVARLADELLLVASRFRTTGSPEPAAPIR